MERLEAAIEKARKERRKAVPSADATQPPPSSAGPEFVREPARPDHARNVSIAWRELAEIKVSARNARNNRISTLSKNSGAGPYDMLRSRTMRIMRENGWKRLAITSPNMACGKTTVAANLAFSLARQSDNRVILLDMDMRRPSMHNILGHRDRWSFHDVLEGKLHPEEQLLRFGANLIFGLNYNPAQNPAELLQSEKTREILAMIDAKFQPDLFFSTCRRCW